jgi:SNF2 family DNA or RNA helicase
MSINSSSIKSFGDSAAERTSTVYSSACTFRCMKCPDLRYCDSCFALHNCAPSKCSSTSSSSSSSISGSNALKVVVFSQWTSMLDLLVPVLQAHKLQFSRLDGKMSQAQRARSLGIFNKDPSVRILLASLKAGGVGLNLTVASHVLLVDPW